MLQSRTGRAGVLPGDLLKEQLAAVDSPPR